MIKQEGFVVDEPPIWSPISLEWTYRDAGISLFHYLLLTRLQCLSTSCAHISFLIASTKSILSVRMVDFWRWMYHSLNLCCKPRVSEVGDIVWIWLGSFFMVVKPGFKNFRFWNNGLGWQTCPHMRRGQWGQIPLVFNFHSCLFPELFCFTLILKRGGLYTLGLGWKTVKARRDIIHLEKPELLHVG